MPCSNCGKTGHNAKTCSVSSGHLINKKNEPHALWLKIDQISEKQANEILKSVIDIKSELAPEGRATYVKAPQKVLPARIAEALKIHGNSEEDE